MLGLCREASSYQLLSNQRVLAAHTLDMLQGLADGMVVASQFTQVERSLLMNELVQSPVLDVHACMAP